MSMSHPYFEPAQGGVVALAHRGFSTEGLENSMAAFQAAVDLGYRYLETDVHGTADGVAVALHDATLDRTTDAQGDVAALPWDTVRRAKIGGVEPVPLFEDILGTWPEVRINVDVKTASGIEPLAEAIERTQSHDRICLGSFSTARRLATLKLLSRPVARSAGTSEAAAFWRGARRMGNAERALAKVDALQVPWSYRGLRLVRPRDVDLAHRLGKQVHVWTVNDRDLMETLLDLGVDGIISDRADLLKEVLVARDQWV